MFNYDYAPVLHRRRNSRIALRLEAFESRIVPTVSIGTLVGGVQSAANSAPFGNSGAAGPNDYVEIVSGAMVTFKKDGTFEDFKFDRDFWSGLGIVLPPAPRSPFEPHITYDPLSDRWFVVELADTPVGVNTGNRVLLARSDTNNPLGTWKAVSYAGSTGFSFDPTLGVDANGVYIGTIDVDSRATFNLQSTTMTSIPKADLLLTFPTLDNATTFVDTSFNLGWNIQAATNFNPTADHASLAAVDLATVSGTLVYVFGKVDRTEVTGTAAANASLGPTSIINIQPNSLPSDARQPDGSQTIDPVDHRFSATVYQVGDLIYMVSSITVDATGTATFAVGSDAVRVTVLSDSTGQVVAEGTWFNPNFDYLYPSIAANSSGDILIGFNRSGPNAGSGATDGNLGAYAVYARIDPNNPTSITFGPEVQLVPGFVPNYHNQPTPPDFWGNYSATTPDPTNPLAFWTTQEFAFTANQWESAIAQVFVSPRISNVSSTLPDGTYFVGDNIPITVKFNNPVTVTGTPQLALNTGAIATYTSGSGTDTLTFTYTVAPGQQTADLDYASASALSLNGGTIQDKISRLDAELPLSAPGAPGSLGANKNIVIDPKGKINGVTSPIANGRYGAGTVININVVFNQPVLVTGTPSLALNTGVNATYNGGSGTNTLTFTYTVALGESSPDLDYTSTTALSLNGGSIIDAALLQNADLTLSAPGAPGSLGANKDIIIDTTAPHVTGVTSTDPDGTYLFGQTIHITVTFHKAVTVTGTPKLTLNSGGTASYSSGSGTDTLVFNYLVGAGDLSADLDYTSTSALDLNSGTIFEASSGLAADITLPAPGAAGSLGANKNIAVDATEAKVTNVTSTKPNGLYGLGAIIDITIKFQRPMNVTGTPLLVLNSGGRASYLSGSGTDTLTFRYTVSAGENATDLDYASASALTLSGGTIQEASGLPANLTLPAPGAAGSLGANKNLVIDTAGPTIVEFRVLFGSKWYNLVGSSRTVLPWQVKGIQVVFNEPVYSGNVRSLGGLTATAFKGLKTRTLTWTFPAISKGSFTATLASAGTAALMDQAGNAIAGFSKAFGVLFGDFDGNGVVDSLDEDGVRSKVAAPYQINPSGYNIFADLSGDGVVNLVDVGIARTRKGQSLP